MDYKDKYYNLINKQMETFNESLLRLEAKIDLKQNEQDQEIHGIKEVQIPELALKIRGILGWAAGAGAMGGFVLTLVLFFLSKIN